MSVKFKKVNPKPDFIVLEHDVLDKWSKDKTFNKLVDKNKGNDTWSFIDGPITANNPMGVHHAWGRTLKDLYQRYHAMNGYDLRYQNGFDCQGLWVEVEVEKELGFKSKKDIENYGVEKFVNLCKERVRKYSKIQTEQSIRLGYWMDWENSYYTMSDENNYTIWALLKKLFEKGKIYRGTDVVPWSGRSGTSYSQMEIIEGRKLVAHRSVFVRLPLLNRENEYILVWTTTPWTLSSNVAAAVNVNLDYVKLKASDDSIYYFAKDNLKFQRLENQFKDKKQWIEGVPKLKTIAQIFNERGGYSIKETIKGSDMIGWRYRGPFDDLDAQNLPGGHPFVKDDLKEQGISAIDCHKIIDGGKDNIGNDIVVSGEGTGIVHIATGCGAIDNKIGKKLKLVEIAPLNDEAKYIEGFGWLTGKLATSIETRDKILEYLKRENFLLYAEDYPHVYPHCWRSGDELVYRSVDEWYINMDWREEIKKVVDDINWIPSWGHDRENEWLDNMGDWMISKKRFWGLALPIWAFEDGSFHVVGSKEELKELAVEGYDKFDGNSPHKPWIDYVKIKHPESGLLGKRIPDVGNPWLDAGIVPFSTLKYISDKEYWNKWFPADFVVECFPGQFRNWFYSLLAMSTVMENKTPFKTLLGHALVKDETGRDMHKSWGNAIWFDDAAEKMGVDVMRWMYSSQNPEHNLLFGYKQADEVRKDILTLWNVYSFFVTYAILDDYSPKKVDFSKAEKIDKWILCKTNEFIKKSTEYYSSFQVYKLMKEASLLLDDLSNWYVRRNRRRFWKSENDSDKLIAYDTLYSCLVAIIKTIAPVIPFLTEEIYNNLVSSVDVDAPESIHLCDFPEYDTSIIDNDLINEIDTLISIVKMGRSARNKANIKIRQPLSSISIYADSMSVDSVLNNKEQILEELNIKTVTICKSRDDIVMFNIKPNYSTLSSKVSGNMKDIIGKLKELNFDKMMDSFKSKGIYSIVVNGLNFDITREDIIIEEIPLENLSISTNQNIAVGVSTLITSELHNEGLIRDLIRHIQNLRKDSDLSINDRINLVIKHDDESLYVAIDKHKKYLLNEVLGVVIDDGLESMDYLKPLKINNREVIIGIKVNN